MSEDTKEGKSNIKPKRFSKNVEDFRCEHCGFDMKGTGYTNHCSKCLWSKHVDIGPGDRAAECKGMMKPTSIEGGTTDGYRIIHRCEKCGHIKANKVAVDDSQDAILAVIKEKTDKMKEAGRSPKRR